MIVETPVAHLAFLSFPGPNSVCINLQVEGKDVKAELTRDQLRGILTLGFKKWFEKDEEATR